MPELTFSIEGVETQPYAAEPLLAFKLQLGNAVTDEVIHTVVVRAQIQIEVMRRHYDPQEQEQLRDLFGTPDRWSQTLRNLLWTHTTTVAPAFKQQCVVNLLVPCTFDFNVAATKYFYGMKDGDLPLLFLFSGSVFYQGPGGVLQVAPIPWDRESRFALPVRVWRQMIELYYPNSAWLSLRQDAFDRLYQFKIRHGIPTWEQTLDRILDAVETKTPS